MKRLRDELVEEKLIEVLLEKQKIKEKKISLKDLIKEKRIQT